MEYERKGVTITWQIENVKYICDRRLDVDSPVIPIDVMDETKWQLNLQRISASSVQIALRRCAEDNGPEEFGLHFQFSAISLQETSRGKLHSEVFQKNGWSNLVLVELDDLYDETTGMVHNPDSVTIRCKIWRQKGSIAKSGCFFARTRIKIVHFVFLRMVRCFSELSVNETQSLNEVRYNERLMEVKFFFRRSVQKKNIHRLCIELVPIGYQFQRLFKFKLFILDSSGEKTDFGKFETEFEFEFKKTRQFTLPIASREKILENKALYLPYDTLSMQFEITFSSGIEYEKLERIEYETDSDDEVKQTEFSKEVESLMCKKDILCDIKLQTDTEALPGNTEILGILSPVFEAMFKTDMKEKIQKCVNIDDLDAETVKNMLLFLYSGTLEELHWKQEMKLYIAAHKYQIYSLKKRCFKVLEKRIDLSNCCVLLLLGDMYQDEDCCFLKEVAQSYINDNKGKILYWDKWRDLEKNCPQFAIEFLRDLLLQDLPDLEFLEIA